MPSVNTGVGRRVGRDSGGGGPGQQEPSIHPGVGVGVDGGFLLMIVKKSHLEFRGSWQIC